MAAMTGAQRFALLRCNGRTMALAADEIAEILPLPTLHRPPGAPKVFAGFLNRSGHPLAVIDMPAVFGEESADDLYRHIVRLRGASRIDQALLVDRVVEAQASATSFEPIEDGASLNGVFAGTLLIEGAPIPLLDLDRLLLAEEAARIAELSQTIERRTAGLADPAA